MIKNCAVCQKEFKTYPSKILLGRGKYCSKICSDSMTLIKKGQHISISTQIKKGQKLPEAWKLNMRGRKAWNKGNKLPHVPSVHGDGRFKKGEHRAPATEFKKGTPIQLHPRWQGGKSFEPYPITFNSQLKEKIRCRDNYKCQLCGVPELETNRKSSVHHIDYVKQNVNELNLICLCLICHQKTNTNRNYWIKYFQERMFNVTRQQDSINA